MPTELEIWRAANQMIQQHGEDAEFEAASRADAMLAKGDVEDQAVWKRILKAVKALRKERTDEALN